MANVPDSVFLPYQQRWVADRSAVRLCEKSRRVGLTWAEAADDALCAAEHGGHDSLYVAYNMDQGKQFMRDVSEWSEHFSLAASEIDQFMYEDLDDKGELVAEISALQIVYNSRKRVVALSSRPSNLRGKAGSVILDEAAFHPDLPGLMKSALALLMWAGRVSVISTHNGTDNYFNQLIEDTRAGKKPYSLHRITLDDALADGLYQRICLRTGQRWTPEAEAAWRGDLMEQYGDGADEELLCIPSTGGGSWLTRPMIEACMIDDAPLLRLALDNEFATWSDAQRRGDALAWCVEHVEPLLQLLPRNLKTYIGLDFGRTGDLSVLAPLSEGADLVYRVPFLLELRNVPFTEQELIVNYLCDRLGTFAGAAFDAGGNGSYLAERTAQRYGPKVQQVKLTQPWYLENMAKFKSAIEDKRLLYPRHADVLADLRALEMTKGVAKVPDSKRSKGTDGKARHGDAAMALALGHYAATSSPPAAVAASSAPQGNPYASERRGRFRR